MSACAYTTPATVQRDIFLLTAIYPVPICPILHYSKDFYPSTYPTISCSTMPSPAYPTSI